MLKIMRLLFILTSFISISSNIYCDGFDGKEQIIDENIGESSFGVIFPLIKDNQHFISFIIPSYNRAQKVGRAIDSIYKQNLNILFEIICVDDASTDNTAQILSEYEKKYDNFHFYRHEINKGTSQARNTAINHAKGDLLFTLDSDNYLEPNSVGKLVELLDKTGCDVACFEEVKYFDLNGYQHSWIYKTKVKGCFKLVDALSDNKNPISSGNYLFTKRSYERSGGYQGRVMETWLFGIKQLATGSTFTILPNSFYWHEVSKDSKWRQNEKSRKNDSETLSIFKQFPELFTPETNKMFANYDLTKQKVFVDLNNGIFKTVPEEALEHLFKAYQYEEKKDYTAAFEEYLNAMSLGCRHKKIYKRAEVAIIRRLLKERNSLI